MRVKYWGGSFVLATAALALLASGCGQGEKQGQTADAAQAGGQTSEKRDHSDWWCAEHGIPEKECSMCEDEVAKACRAKGDWCEKHDRAKSQCFLCDPGLKEKFAARFRAKYGKEPPPVKEEPEEPPKKKSKE